MFKHAIEVHLCSVLQIAFPVQANLHPQKLLCVPVAIFLRIRIVSLLLSFISAFSCLLCKVLLLILRSGITFAESSVYRDHGLKLVQPLGTMKSVSVTCLVTFLLGDVVEEHGAISDLMTH